MFLYLDLPACGHAYGVSAQDDPRVYNSLYTWFKIYGSDNHCFLQNDSAISNPTDKSYLFVEFLGVNPDKVSDLANEIAFSIGAILVKDNFDKKDNL